MPRLLLSIPACLLCLALAATMAFAQDAPKDKAADKPTAQAAVPDKPAKTDEAATKAAPVAIEHADGDVVGTRLVYHLKELLGRSSLMRLTNKEEKKLVLLIATAEEFSGRPAVSSIYSVTWLYSAKSGSLRYFLKSQMGVADAATLEQTVESILTQTDKVAETYSYLFQ